MRAAPQRGRSKRGQENGQEDSEALEEVQQDAADQDSPRWIGPQRLVCLGVTAEPPHTDFGILVAQEIKGCLSREVALFLLRAARTYETRGQRLDLLKNPTTSDQFNALAA